MLVSSNLRRTSFGALSLYVGSFAVMILIAARRDSGSPDIQVAIVSGFSVGLGLIVSRRRPLGSAGPALILLGAAPTFVAAVEAWGRSANAVLPMPSARAVAVAAQGVWVWNLAGFLVLAATFPDGFLPGRRWRSLPFVFIAVGVLTMVVLPLQPEMYAANGGSLAGAPPLVLPGAVNIVVLLGIAGLLIGTLVATVASVVVRYSTGTESTRNQLRWFMLGCGAVPVLLLAGWGLDALGASLTVAYSPFMAAILLLLPMTVTLAILRHDLFDIDRLLNNTIAWILTTVAAATLFAVTVVVVTRTGLSAVPWTGNDALVAATFVTALVLAPLHGWLHDRIGRLIDRERVVVTQAMRAFVDRVRDGDAQPEQLESVLRTCLGDDGLRLLLRIPGRDGFTLLNGKATTPAPAAAAVTLRWHGSEIGLVELTRGSARAVRRARAAISEARLAIDVSRLRLELREALMEARGGRMRLVQATAQERRRIERDLHDGAQQQIVAVGMRLRSVQRQMSLGDPNRRELDLAVNSLGSIVGDLRRLANGVGPSMLDDGLDAALNRLVVDSPVPVQLEVETVEASDVVATTAFFIVAESLANALKHAHASRIEVTVGPANGRLILRVHDDGIGGVPVSGLRSLRDRVSAIAGDIAVDSPPGRGTTITALL